MVSSEWRMGTPNGPFAIRYGAAPRQLSKCLKTLKTARAGYWIELAWISDRRHVRFGSAPFCWSLWMQQLRRVRVIKPGLSWHVTGSLGLDKLAA